MKIKIQITVESDKGQPEVVREVAHLDRGTIRLENLGLTLAEARSILAGIEQTLVEQQAAEFRGCLKSPDSRQIVEYVVHSSFRTAGVKPYSRFCEVGIGRTFQTPSNGFLAIHVSASSLVRATLSRLAILRRQHS
jgi:hypothetical protein